MPTFTSLAEDLLARAKQLDAFLADNGIESPSFDKDTLADVDLPEELRSVRSALANGADELKKLAMGPVVFGTELAVGVRLSSIRSDHLPPSPALSSQHRGADIRKSGPIASPSASSTTMSSPPTSPWTAA